MIKGIGIDLVDKSRIKNIHSKHGIRFENKILSLKELEDILQTKVMLNLWVKVKSGWTDNEAMLSTMGYDLGKTS